MGKHSRKPVRRSRITRLHADGEITSAPGAARRGLRGIALTPRDRARTSGAVSNVLYFDRGGVLPRRADYGSMIAHATRLCQDRTLIVTLIGHANRGESRSAAKLVGLLRARNVGAVLVGLGARRSQVHAKSAGSSEPAGDPSTRRGHALNRRVNVVWPDSSVGTERRPMGRRGRPGARRRPVTRVPL
jgi:outer membrane protein OmpA-like peptidoglycan-associated protein